MYLFNFQRVDPVHESKINHKFIQFLFFSKSK